MASDIQQRTIPANQTSENRFALKIGSCGRTALGPELPLHLDSCTCNTGGIAGCTLCRFSKTAAHQISPDRYPEMKCIEALACLIHGRDLVNAKAITDTLSHHSRKALSIRFGYDDGTGLKVEYQHDGSLPKWTVIREDRCGVAQSHDEFQHRLDEDFLNDARCYLGCMFPDVELDF